MNHAKQLDLPPNSSLSYRDGDFERDYERQPFMLGHSLHQHPLFSLEALMSLAERLPQDNIEFNAGDVPANLPQGRKPGHGYSAVETIKHIRECQTWLGLKKIEQIPEYKQVLDELLDSVQPAIERYTPGMHHRQAFVFVTSPNSMVPYHMDPEHNFLVQIHGDKTFTAFDKADRELLPEATIERFYRQNERKLMLDQRLAGRGQRITLHAGDAMHVPINMPHYVENGDDISISLSITFATPWADRREKIYAINGRLRSFGIEPTPFGVAPWRDSSKLAALNAMRLLRRGN